MKTYRKPKNQKIYEREMKRMKKEPGCRMCLKIKTATRQIGPFFIASNDFKYDKISDINDILILKRHRGNLSLLEWIKLRGIFKNLDAEGYYNHTMFNFSRRSSIPAHWHWQLFKFEAPKNVR